MGLSNSQTTRIYEYVALDQEQKGLQEPQVNLEWSLCAQNKYVDCTTLISLTFAHDVTQTSPLFRTGHTGGTRLINSRFLGRFCHHAKGNIDMLFLTRPRYVRHVALLLVYRFRNKQMSL